MTTSAPRAGSVVVGIDGSFGSDQALDWAVDQALLEHRPLTIVLSDHLMMGGDSLSLGLPGVDVAAIGEHVRQAGTAVLVKAERRAIRQAPDLVVQRVLSDADPRLALVRLSESAATVVVGSRGRGPIVSALLGSVSVHVARHAACPVVVVRGIKGSAPGSGVVVAVDDTAPSQAAVEHAYRTASVRSWPLTALRVVWDPAHRGDHEHMVADGDPGTDDDRALLSQATAAMQEAHPDVRTHHRLVRGLREHQLARASRGADLLVVGSSPRGLLDDFLFGSVATVVEHAACDVAVVPGGPRST